MDLAAGLAALQQRGLVLPANTAVQLEAFLALLHKWNQTYNLTAVRERERMVTYHLLDALAILPYLPSQPGQRVLDVGSGGGVPGIPLAIVQPGWACTLLDSNHKKGAFLRQAAAELGLRNVTVAVERIERHQPDTPYHVVVSRGFADLGSFARCAALLTRPGGRLYAMKGIVPHEELSELPAHVAVVDMPAVDVPGLEAKRHLVVMEPS